MKFQVGSLFHITLSLFFNKENVTSNCFNWVLLSAKAELLSQLDCFCISAVCKCFRWMHNSQLATSWFRRRDVSPNAQIALLPVLQCGQASYLVKHNAFSASRPSSTRAQMINWIQLHVAQLQLNPVMLWYLLQSKKSTLLFSDFLFFLFVCWKTQFCHASVTVSFIIWRKLLVQMWHSCRQADIRCCAGTL